MASGYGLIILIYLAVLMMGDAQNGFFEFLPLALTQLPWLMALALISFLLRYVRWFFLLRSAGNSVPLWRGWLSYLSGFAFTATPGKVGELIRIRYFGRLNVKASRVMSAFIFERALDLVVVLCMASVWVVDWQMFGLAASFVSLILLAIGAVMFQPGWLQALGSVFASKGFQRLARLLFFLARGLAGCRVWFKPWPLFLSLLVGVVSWSITAFAFVLLLYAINLDVPLLAAFSTYPLAMLAGAVSMLPGGVGTTEAAIILQLQWHGVPVATAMMAAVVVRLSTMWFSVVCGLLAILFEELKFSSRF
jgi:uncharacterized protein (TIRG00374 family)